MKTHPDAAGSDIHLEKHLRLTRDYEEARAHLIETLEVPDAFHLEEEAGKLALAKKTAHASLLQWKRGLAEIYLDAEPARRVTRHLEQRFGACKDEKHANLLRQDIVQSLSKIARAMKELDIAKRIPRLIQTEENEKYRKKYMEVL